MVNQVYKSESLPWEQGKVAIACFVLFFNRVLGLLFGSEPKASLLKSWDGKYSVPALGADVLSGKSSQGRKELRELYSFMEAKMPLVNTVQVNTAQEEAALHATVSSCPRDHWWEEHSPRFSAKQGHQQVMSQVTV